MWWVQMARTHIQILWEDGLNASMLKWHHWNLLHYIQINQQNLFPNYRTNYQQIMVEYRKTILVRGEEEEFYKERRSSERRERKCKKEKRKSLQQRNSSHERKKEKVREKLNRFVKQSNKVIHVKTEYKTDGH